MNLIVAGSRGITDGRLVAAAIKASGFPVTRVYSGTARGIDQLGEVWARERGIPVVRFPADWQRYGRSAGPRRNAAMTEAAVASPEGGALVAVWDGCSRGTAHVIESARHRGLAVFVYRAEQVPAMAGACTSDNLLPYW